MAGGIFPKLPRGRSLANSDDPGSHDISDMPQRFNHVNIQHRMAIRALEAFDVRIPVRFSWLGVVELDAALFAPSLEDLQDVPCPVVDPYRLQLATPFDEAVRRPHNATSIVALLVSKKDRLVRLVAN